MEKSDVLGSSTAPLTWHDFLERMRHPSAADFVKSIKSFIVSFSNNAPDLEKDSAAVQEFLAKMEGAFRVHSLWAGCSEEELESAGEGLEKYVMTKLYSRVFASLPEDVHFDEQLSEKMALIQQFIQPENLDIKPAFQNETSWLLAQKELQKINMYKAPRDKLVCILTCCKIINNLLLNASISSNENPPGADEFLPVLIYVTIKANPPQLHSNLQYIQRYRRDSRLVSEAAYFFTNILSAESFISNIDAKSLSIEETEFEKNMETARALLSGLATDPEDTGNQRDRDSYSPRTESIKNKLQGNAKNKRESMPPTKEHISQAKNSEDHAQVNHEFSMTKKLSISDLEKKGATELLTENQISSIFQEYPYLYSRMGDLTINDVEDLLNRYKQLVFKYVCLSKGMGVASHSLPLPESPTQTHTNTESEKISEEVTAAEEVNNDKYEDVDRLHEILDGGSLKQLESSECKISEDNPESVIEKV